MQAKDQILTELEDKTEYLSNELKGKNKHFPELERKAEYLSQELHQRTQALFHLQDNSALLLQDLERQNEQLSLLESKLMTLDDHNRNLSDENKELLKHKNQLLSQVQTTEQDILNLENQIKNLQHQLVQSDLLLTDIAYLTPSDNEQDPSETHNKLQSELASIAEQNKSLQRDLSFMRTNFIRERNNAQNLEAILNEVSQQLKDEKEIVKEQSFKLSDKEAQIQTLIHTTEISSRDSYPRENKHNDSQELSDDLKKQYQDLQQHATELTLQLDNLSNILREKEKAQMKAEQNTLKMMNKNEQLTAEIEYLKTQLRGL
jgi:chromosome segregation ATPase